MPDTVDAFERASAGQLSVGVAEADITPDDDQYLAGFSLARLSTAVHTRLKARAIVLEVGELRVAIVGVDNLGLQREDADWIKRRIVGFPNGCVFLCSSHTHAAPDLVGMWGWYMLTSGRDLEYLKKVRDGVVEAVARATSSLRPARLLRAESRVAPEGMIRNSNRRGVYDRRLTVLQARDLETDEPIGALLHLACHPEVLKRQNTLISSDYVGELCDRWRDGGLGQAVFVNGALGAMVTPEPRGAEGLQLMGQSLFETMRDSLESAEPVQVDTAVVRRRDVFLPMESSFLALARTLVLIPRELHENYLRSTVGYLRFGDVEICTLPGETEPGLAARIYASSGRPNMLLFGLADDEVGYLLSERDARDREYAYERSMSPGPRSGEFVLDALVGR